MNGLGDGARLRISGRPTEAELAAVVLALHAVRGEQPAAAPDPPAWQRAARLEAVGGRPVRSRLDLEERSATRR